MSAPRPDEVNPYAAPQAEDAPPAPPSDRDADLRHEYLGAILLAAISGGLAVVLLVAVARRPASDVGEFIALVAGWVAWALAIVSLLFVFITLRAAVRRVLLHLRRIRESQR
jgi:hypothetical protein